MNNKAIIIGAGIGGLSLAVRLQARGFETTVLEKNAAPGGHATQFRSKGYVFDGGPTLITAPEVLSSIFEAAGVNLEDRLELKKLDPFYRVYFHDKTYIDYSADTEKMIAQMSKFDARDAANYPKFMEFSRKIYEAVIVDGLGSESFDKASTMIKFVPRAARLGAILPGHFAASRFFRNFRHRFLFSFHPLFIGGNPFKVPAIYLMISYLEKTGGVWYSPGGMKSLVDSLADLFTELGGKIITNKEVEKIKIENKKVAGVFADGEFYPADLVVSNADATHTYKDLIDDEKLAWSKRKAESKKHSMSAYILFLGLKKQYDELKHHTLILSERYKELVTDIFDRRVVPPDFSLYLHAPSKTDSAAAPPGCDSVYALAPVANLQSGYDWSGDEFGERIIDFLERDFGLKDLRENIEVRFRLTPRDFLEKRNSYFGSPWGLEPILTQTALFRPHNADPKIENLFLVGAGTHPGAGLPGVMMSAEATEKVIMEKFSEA